MRLISAFTGQNSIGFNIEDQEVFSEMKPGISQLLIKNVFVIGINPAQR